MLTWNKKKCEIHWSKVDIWEMNKYAPLWKSSRRSEHQFTQRSLEFISGCFYLCWTLWHPCLTSLDLLALKNSFPPPFSDFMPFFSEENTLTETNELTAMNNTETMKTAFWHQTLAGLRSSVQDETSKTSVTSPTTELHTLLHYNVFLLTCVFIFNNVPQENKIKATYRTEPSFTSAAVDLIWLFTSLAMLKDYTGILHPLYHDSTSST